MKAYELRPGDWFVMDGRSHLCIRHRPMGYVFVSGKATDFDIRYDRDVELLPLPAGYAYIHPKPEPKWLPFANSAEFRPHRDRWIRHVGIGNVGRVTSYSDKIVEGPGTNKVTYQELLKWYVFDDTNDPCGVME